MDHNVKNRQSPLKAPEQSGLIVRAKLHRPVVGPGFVYRKRLIEHMDNGRGKPLALVSAPAGYGKSVLVSQWAAELEYPCAWLSLDTGDNDLRIFLKYFVAAIDMTSPGALPLTTGLIEALELPPLVVVAGYLSNELEALDMGCTLVLEDYHHIGHASPVHDLLNRILEHPPPHIQLVLITRRDPPLPLPRLRANNQVNEVRLEELRFTDAEVAEFLAKTLGVAVSKEALACLQREGEGWAVGLRLIALALRHVDAPDSFLKALRGGLPYMQEYLLKEVLAREASEVCDWMLKSSVLSRFSSGLLEAVCGPGFQCSRVPAPAAEAQSLFDCPGRSEPLVPLPPPVPSLPAEPTAKAT